jgi:dTDP-4-dehydrorhamnose reductase
MKRVLITGANGQLGRCFIDEVRQQKLENDYYFTDVLDLDITEKKSIENYVAENGIDIIVNCAAYTNVEKAEEVSEKDKVYDINCKAVQNLAEVCSDRELFLIQISTDFVFNGDKNTPYDENDACTPINVYGWSKYFGENEAFWCENHMIIRTAWLYSEYGNNFFKTMLNRINNKQDTTVVCDQIGTPTYAKDLARFIIHLIEREDLNSHKGIYHFTNQGCASWYDFAASIEKFTTSKIEYIKPCLSKFYLTLAERPKYSVLSKERLNEFDFKQRHWMEALCECIDKYEKNNYGVSQ